MNVALVTLLIAQFTAYVMEYTAGRHHHGTEVEIHLLSEQALTVQKLSPMLECP